MKFIRSFHARMRKRASWTSGLEVHVHSYDSMCYNAFIYGKDCSLAFNRQTLNCSDLS